MLTSIIKLQNNDGVEITLCGAIHIGTQQYFNQLNSIADQSQIVLYEGIKMEPDATNNLKQFYKNLANLTNLTVQNRLGYDNNPKWINIDLYSKNFDDKLFKKINRINDRLANLSEKELIIIKKILSFILKSNISKFLIDLKSFFNSNKYFLIKLRNYNILINLYNQLNKYNKISVIYGEGHLNHLIKHLKKSGFKIINKSYLNNSLI